MKLHSSFDPLILLCITILSLATATSAAGDQWQILQRNTGVSAMHMQLLHNDRVIIFDSTNFGRSNISLLDGKCGRKADCTAHSVEYDVAANAVRPLTVLTDTWCSSGTVGPDGSLLQTGGFGEGDTTARTFRPCGDRKCDWEETPKALAARRWYATNQILPDGRAIVVGGRSQYNYEFYPKTGQYGDGAIPFRFLMETNDKGEENNLYPFLHLIDGKLFVYSNNRAILFDYAKNTIVKTYPQMPGAHPRNYPSTGSSVLLPMRAFGTIEAEVLICGGAPRGAFGKARGKHFVPALDTCGRIKITDEAPSWAMETMPMARAMGDMILLPSGREVLIINGVAAGVAGWELGREPVMTPVTYRHYAPPGQRFAVQAAAKTPRLYHSSAVLLRDGRVLVGGSNAHATYSFSGVEYPTDLSLEAYLPEYLSSENNKYRPKITTPVAESVKYGKLLKLRFSVEELGHDGVAVTMVAPAFSTHSFSMNQRVLFLSSDRPVAVGGKSYAMRAVAPKTREVAPPGYYMLFIVSKGIPSEGVWVKIY